MGVDAEIYVIGAFTDDELAAADRYLTARLKGGPVLWEREGEPRLAVWPNQLDGDRVGIYTLSRYYGPGYERGEWPGIHCAIMAMRGAFPGRPVYYGGTTRSRRRRPRTSVWRPCGVTGSPRIGTPTTVSGDV